LILAKEGTGKWPCVNASIEVLGSETENIERQDQFSQEVGDLFDRLQEGLDRLGKEEKSKCGQWGVAVDVILRIDLAKKEILLDRLFKYCNLDFHLFTALLEIIKHNFPEYHFVVPSLQGYELAREVYRYLGVPEIEYIYLKNDTDERLLKGKKIREITLENILEDTKRHYDERGGIEKKKLELGSGTEISMYYKGTAGEEEILWMQIRIPLS
jgi:hypothetical protein